MARGGGSGGGFLIDAGDRGLVPFGREPVFTHEFDDEALGLKIVDTKQLEFVIRKIMDKTSTGGFMTRARDDFNSNRDLPLRRLENSHWDSEEDRLLYLRCYQ